MAVVNEYVPLSFLFYYHRGVREAVYDHLLSDFETQLHAMASFPYAP